MRQKQPSEVFRKKGSLKTFGNFTEKHLTCSVFLMKLQAFRPSDLELSEKETPKHVFTCEILQNF